MLKVKLNFATVSNADKSVEKRYDIGVFLTNLGVF